MQREEIIYTGCAKIFRYTNSQKYVGNKIKMVELSIRREIKKIGKFSSSSFSISVRVVLKNNQIVKSLRLYYFPVIGEKGTPCITGVCNKSAHEIHEKVTNQSDRGTVILIVYHAFSALSSDHLSTYVCVESATKAIYGRARVSNA